MKDRREQEAVLGCREISVEFCRHRCALAQLLAVFAKLIIFTWFLLFFFLWGGGGSLTAGPESGLEESPDGPNNRHWPVTAHS